MIFRKNINELEEVTHLSLFSSEYFHDTILAERCADKELHN